MLRPFRGIRQIQRWHSNGVVKMAYVRHGDVTENTPFVICHGLFGQKQNWNSVGKALAKRMGTPVYAIDFRNHGESPWTKEHTYPLMAEDLAVFLEDVAKETGQNKINLLGHSMGGKVVSYLALHPQLNGSLNKLIVEDISPHRESSESLFLGYVDALQKVNLKQERAQILEQLEDVIPDLTVRQFLLTNLIRSKDGFRWKMNLEAIGGALSHILSFKLVEKAFDGPVLFIYGGRSDYFLEQDKPQVKILFPNVQFEVIPDTGHWLHAENPQLFMDKVVDFLQT
ncbi:unnamed protein product [Bursaphelenchus xylophilus]|uniref:sn-1-specific diacylglycerol lipase ABHD11 n=1 Tax=Bursaphelenchus xylophilus TaxID=6326 RepID=A0A1I7S930_BURXY|nr:unnamed protein product [Bursaphelenchus xylophilus]CAG9086193.1 unnamed protein product [Bursaphelenchus xylophilus]